MSNEPRVTIAQVAEAVGVHKSTVSLALRNDPRVAGKTRERIMRAVAELGYVPDAHLSNLMGYLRRISSEQVAKHESIAYLTSESSPQNDIHRMLFFRNFRSGVHGELGRLGYRMETFKLCDYAFNLKRVESVLKSRNIQGIVVAPPVEMDDLGAFNWDGFAAITLGYRLSQPKIHRVISDQMAAMSMAIEHMAKSGYKRIVFAYAKGRDRHSRRRWSITLVGSRRLHPSLEDTFTYAGEPDDDFAAFFKQCKADGLICMGPDYPNKLTAAGLNLPRDFGCLLLSADNGPEHFAGIEQEPQLLGKLAAQQIAGMLSRNEVGLPEVPFTLQVPPKWHHGRTCPPR
jgi:LacI family transcriptional regulator